MNNLILLCLYEESGILNKKLKTPLEIGVTTQITLLGIYIPRFDNRETVLCSLNNIDFNLKRKFIIIGSEKIEDDKNGMVGVKYISPSGSTNNSIFYSILKTSNPRLTTGSLTIEFGFDYASRKLKEYIFENSPIVHITFPDEYDLSYQQYRPNSTYPPNVTLNLITTDSCFKSTTVLNISSFIFGTKLTGNRISINLPDPLVNPITNITLQFIIHNIVNPSDEMKSTGRFRVTFTNSIQSFMYKVFTNGNTHYSENTLDTLIPNLNNVENSFNNGIPISYNRQLLSYRWMSYEFEKTL